MRRVAAVTLLVALSDVRTVAADGCAPRAHLTGDPPAVASVVSELGKLGVSVGTASPGCPVVEAAVEVDRSGGIAVAVQDGGRSEGRVVTDASLAAVWIESWARDRLDPWGNGVLAVPTRVAAGPPSATPPDSGRTRPDISVSSQAPTALAMRPSLSVDYVTAWSDDSRQWTGFDVAGCAHRGKLCLGGRARYLSQSFSTDLTGADRTDLSVMATASAELAVGSMKIAPEIGLGVGRMVTARKDGCKPVMPDMCDPQTDPTCNPDGTPQPVCADGTVVDANGNAFVGDGLRATTYAPRASVALRVAVPLFPGVWLDGVAAATAAPFSHRDSFEALDKVMGVAPAELALPGEPLVNVSLGIGLRIEAPEHHR